MKNEKLISWLQSAVLAFLLAFGAVGIMATGLNLNITEMGRLALILMAVCAVAPLIASFSLGSWLLAGATVLPAVYLAKNEEAWAQLVDMLCRITRYYQGAYGWPMVRSPLMGTGPMDIPLTILGLWIGIFASHALSRDRGSGFAMLLAALPLIACVVVTDTVPNEKYLYIWLLGMVLILLSSGVRRVDPKWGRSAVLLAAVPTALALGLLFHGVPREGYDKHPDELQEQVIQWIEELPDLWNRVSDEIAEKVDGTVQPESINLQNTGPRIKRVYPVMDVTAQTSGTIYLRGQHYDSYTGTGWEVSDSQERFEAPEIAQEVGTITISTRTVRDVIYLPYYMDEEPNLFDGRIDNPQKEKVYSYTHRALTAHWQDLVRILGAGIDQPLLNEGRSRYLQLPESTRAWAEELTAKILISTDTATAVADVIANYVRNSAVYDLNTPRMDAQAGDFARWFLEESDAGYCVHFATAATVLLRAAGVEARYVEGYMFTARMGQETTVTADQAHAWAEYYEPLLGAWIVLEATPAEEGSTETEAIQTEAPETTGTQPDLPDQATEPEKEATKAPDTPGEGPSVPESPEKKPLDLSWLRWILIPVLCAAVLEGQRILRLRRRAIRRTQGDRNRRALACWRELERYHRLLKSDAPEEGRNIAQKAKYSRQGISPEELRALEGHLRTAREAMGQRPWYLKMVDKYIFAVY